MTRKPNPPAEASIVSVETFIQATRDSGYKSTATALAELIDNALDAGAEHIEVGVEEDPADPSRGLIVWTYDDGRGMDPITLQQSLRFGGSSRFGSRVDLGRYGMGLPNSSMSQARRVDVYTWQSPGRVLRATLDLDDVAQRVQTGIPEPTVTELPSWWHREPGEHGTLVVWSRCDRLDYKRASTIARKLRFFFGRIYRYYLWDGVELLINGSPTQPIDPLFLREDSLLSGGELYEETLKYDVDFDARDDSLGGAGLVTVTFSLLPVAEWHSLSNREKRRRGISKAAGVSVVRGKREIDYGWFFLGKRKENYDDWWRCEVRFEPTLDEVFGITHTKQQIRPCPELVEIFGADMEAIARALNARVRREHQRLQSRNRFRDVELRARRAEKHLPQIEPCVEPPGGAIAQLAGQSAALKALIGGGGAEQGVDYTVLEEEADDARFYLPGGDGNRRVLVLNRKHAFHQQLYRAIGEDKGCDGVKGAIDLLLLSALRAELAASGDEQEVIARFRERWSQNLAAFVKS